MKGYVRGQVASGSSVPLDAFAENFMLQEESMLDTGAGSDIRGE